MASDNQPISDKRRRLFKALSAAPVVATLRPGEALARMSSYQCAAQDMGHPDRLFYLANSTPAPAVAESYCSAPGTAGCYWYDKRYYWELDDSKCDDLAGHILVDVATSDVGTVGDSAPSTRYYLVNTSTSVGLALPTSYQVSVDGQNRLTLKRPSGTGTAMTKCANNATRQTGLFLVLGYPKIDGGAPVDWVPTGVYPQQALSMDGTDRMAGTCLDSFDSTTSKILAKG